VLRWRAVGWCSAFFFLQENPIVKATLWIVAALAGVLVVMTVVGWLLPVGHVATRSVLVAAHPAAVFETIAAVERYPEWWSDVSRVERLPAEQGRTRFRQHDANGAIIMEVVEASPPHRFVTRIADPDQPFGGTWTWDIAPEPDGTRVTITERGEVYHPIFRFLSRFVFGHTGTMDSALEALARFANEERKTKN
jgi:uncharacterized protein YndB with AHSA1/START domain